MERRKIFAVSASAIAVMLAMASFAWACITVQGSATIATVVHKSDESKTECGEGEKCAAPGDIVKVNAKGAVPLTKFFLHFRNYKNSTPWNGGKNCYGTYWDDDQRISKGVMSDEKGNIRTTKGTVPMNARSTNDLGGALGPALVCFIDKTQNIVTEADTVTVI